MSTHVRKELRMAQKNEAYSVLYRLSLVVIVGQTLYEVKTSDIVSITIMNNYDTRTFPIILV